MRLVSLFYYLNTNMDSYSNFPQLPSTQFFNHLNPNYNNESMLYEFLNMEQKNLHGSCLEYYIISYDTNYDKLFGEDNNRRFVRHFPFMGELVLPKETKQFTTMGIGWTDIFHIYVSKLHYSYASTLNENKVSAYSEYIPREGDILNTKYNNVYYEIISVKSEEQQFLQRKHSWDIIVRVIRDKSFSYSPDTSATMVDISKYNDKSDLFNIGKFIKETDEDVSNATKIEYEPKTKECDVNDPFNDWTR